MLTTRRLAIIVAWVVILATIIAAFYRRFPNETSMFFRGALYPWLASLWLFGASVDVTIPRDPSGEPVTQFLLAMVLSGMAMGFAGLVLLLFAIFTTVDLWWPDAANDLSLYDPEHDDDDE